MIKGSSPVFLNSNAYKFSLSTATSPKVCDSSVKAIPVVGPVGTVSLIVLGNGGLAIGAAEGVNLLRKGLGYMAV